MRVHSRFAAPSSERSYATFTRPCGSSAIVKKSPRLRSGALGSVGSRPCVLMVPACMGDPVTRAVVKRGAAESASKLVAISTFQTASFIAFASLLLPGVALPYHAIAPRPASPATIHGKSAFPMPLVMATGSRQDFPSLDEASHACEPSFVSEEYATYQLPATSAASAGKSLPTDPVAFAATTELHESPRSTLVVTQTLLPSPQV